MVINIEMEQLTMLISSWFKNPSLPTLNEPLKTLNTIVGISKYLLQFYNINDY